MRLTTYTQNQKIDALKLWLVTGNLSQVARDLKIPYETIKQWKYSKWWQETAVEIRAEGRLELSSKLKKVAEKALGETLDRLENGEVRISPTGEKILVPVTASVAAKITTDFLQKVEELDRTQDADTLMGVQDRLLALAASFEKFSRKVRRIEVEDVPQDIIEGDFHERTEQLGVQEYGDSDGETGSSPESPSERGYQGSDGIRDSGESQAGTRLTGA